MFRREHVKLGALPSPHGAFPELGAFASSRFLAGVGSNLDPQPIDLFPFHRPRVQRRQNCVAHARMNVLQVFMWIANRVPGPLLSVDWAYALGQLMWQPPPRGGRFPDSGSSCVLVGKGIWDHGVVTEESYPEEGDNGLAIPPDDVWQLGAAAKVVGMHRLDEGENAPAQLCAALAIAAQGGASASNIIVTADDAMGALPEDGVLESPGGAVWGGHDLACLAFDPKRGPRGAFGMADTWGRTRFWLSWDYVARHGREMLITEAVPAAPVN